MDDEEMEKKLPEYLRRKGLRVTELAQQGERNRLPTSSAPAPAPGPSPSPSPSDGVVMPSMPGGFLSFAPNGHPYYPPPWPPGNGILSQPLPYPFAQHAAPASGFKAKPVITIDDGDGVRTEKRLSWKSDEDVRLVRAWLKYSNDPIGGNSKKTERYWADLLAFYNSITSTKRKREAKHLKDRFQKIKRSVGFFCLSMKKAASIDASKQSDDQLIEKALQFYLDDYKEGPFIAMHCWKVLRDEPKWHAVLEDLERSNKRKLGDEGEVGNSTPMAEDSSEKESPVVVKEAKKHCNGKSKVKASDKGLDEDIRKYMDLQAAAKKRHEEFIGIQLRVSDAKVQAARLKKEAAMLKTYKSFMSMDTKEMTEEMKTEHMIGLKLLREKLFNNTS